jgi:hypothetical protein
MSPEPSESTTSDPLRFPTCAASTTSLFIEPTAWTAQASFYPADPESTSTPGHSSKHRVFDHSAADGISETLYF